MTGVQTCALPILTFTHVVISSVIGKEESSTRVNVSIIKWSYTRYDLLELSKEVVVAIGPN